MAKFIPLLAIVLVIRYFALDGGAPLGVTMRYGFDAESCEVQKARINLQPDPYGTKTILDCVDEKDLGMFMAPGEHS